MTERRHRFHAAVGLALALMGLGTAATLEAQVGDPPPDTINGGSAPAGDGASTPLSTPEAIARIDALHFGMDLDGALAVAREALTLDSTTAQLLHRGARQTVHSGMIEEAADRRDDAKALFLEAEGYARRALENDSLDARAWSWLAISTGRRSSLEGVFTRIELAGVLKEAADRSLALDSVQSGALHVLGAWHAEIRRLNRIERFTARRLPGGDVFGAAEWSEAERLLRRAVEVAPEEVVHRLELGRILMDTDRKEEGLGELRRALELDVVHPTDPLHLEAAREILLREGG